jgi:hypothetical protein
MIESAQWEVRATLLQGWSREALIAELPRVVELSLACGVDIREQARKLLRVLAPELVPPTPEPSEDTPEAEIAGLYAALEKLQETGDEPAYQETLDRLRRIQTQEAARMAEFFKAKWGTLEGEFAQRKLNAEQLLAKARRRADPGR